MLITALVIGAISGGGIVATMWLLDAISFRDYLLRKADPAHRTPLCLKGKLYVLVPEREYMAIKLVALGNRPGIVAKGD